ncbi:MAG: isoprenyl transferase [Nitrospinae bacterium]|nr:isoprenyl transferase [Nitrospinota bacterium]
MDGNGRWAKKIFLPRVMGHRAGVQTVDKIVTLASEIKIKALTLYSFSAENWNRPSAEVEALMGILKEYLMKELRKMLDNNIRFNTIGRVADLPKSAVECIEEVRESTKKNTGTVLTLALSYSGRNEIIDAVRSIARDVQNGRLGPDEITGGLMDARLDTAGLPELDLLIRTSGEERISNFLLWQSAYAEFYFTDVLWPDFTGMNFLEAIKDYQKRERRFGLSGEQTSGEIGGPGRTK